MNNPPAFPTPVIVPEGQFTTISNDGMTLRDYFAAAAIQALMVRERSAFHAEHAYEMADAMLKAREQ